MKSLSLQIKNDHYKIRFARQDRVLSRFYDQGQNDFKTSLTTLNKLGQSGIKKNQNSA